DGKIPHEISQSASLVRWFETFPYGYASADATPLFVIAVQNYVQASGDTAFAKEQWPRLKKALDFMRANFESHGYFKNYQVGHGWVEGGPLLPVEVELYQAGCYVEAVRALSALGRVVPGSEELASSLEKEFTGKRALLDQLFWLPQSKSYAFALDTTGKAVEQPTVLSTVPMWFRLLDEQHTATMIEALSEEAHQSDWGMRIISSQSTTYGPEGYHYGSVWPLFTGWASVGEYRYHAAHSGYANLRANAFLTLDGAGGNPTEVLSGMTYSPLSTASPHQIWSAAMVISPLLRGLCGLEVDALARVVTFAPHLPADWPVLGINGVPVGGDSVDFRIERDDKSQRLLVNNHGSRSLRLRFEPAYSRASALLPAKFDGAPVNASLQRNALDQHPQFDLTVPAGQHTLTIPHSSMFGISLPYAPPQLGAYSQDLKIVAERWSDSNLKVDLELSGRGSRSYRLQVSGAALVSSVNAARLDGSTLIVDMPPGDGYVRKTVSISLRSH
ncbi:MAG: hypothetical protein JO022_01185, partial [Acidobacteriaceae bacterium]|nr:hypothetical protein [Acidobacteriaceae bacterium]